MTLPFIGAVFAGVIAGHLSAVLEFFVAHEVMWRLRRRSGR